ncbi:class I SAM-dependent methyltransferase [Kitasatospora brasiliensis]|uniref:class I SAM-dependent methyltransferase n=1 Tax=Kitasatospora brasiliensis TaxID=3058040 RepID=UPI003D7823C0
MGHPGSAGELAAYDRIGVGYRQVRRPDPRLHALIGGALGGARTVVNVGAGAGSYEPEGAEVTAVDPSQVMLDQHPGRRKVKASASRLPFADGAFDAAMAVLTVHHWPDLRQGLAELRRVARRRADLASGEWYRRYADLLDRESVDYGYRLVVAGERARDVGPADFPRDRASAEGGVRE